MAGLAAEAAAHTETLKRTAQFDRTAAGDLLPSDHIDTIDAGGEDAGGDGPGGGAPGQLRLGPLGWVRWFWRQLTSMRTALFLLLLLALAAVPGSLVPQHLSDPNGVTQYKIDHPVLYPILDKLQVFDTYSSAWFSAIYLLLFVSLVGCIIPRVKHHYEALRAQPPRTPFRLNRMAGFRTVQAPEGVDAAAAVAAAQKTLKAQGYRTVVFEGKREVSVSAERGYLRETGNLVFHIALLGMLVVAGIGSGFGWTAQRIVTVGQTFVDTNVNLDSFNPGRFVDGNNLPAYSVQLNDLTVKYDTSANALGEPLDYDASVTATRGDGSTYKTHIKVNHPLLIEGTNVYLLGNGYAPVLTFRDPSGKVVGQQTVPFLAQDADLTSQGVVKVSDGLKKQLGMIGVFMPTAGRSATGQLQSTYPGLTNPRVSLTVFEGDLGLNSGVPQSVYALNTDKLTQIAGPTAKTPALDLGVGQTAQLPGGLGSVTFDSVVRYASLDIHHDPTQLWVLTFAALIFGGLLTALFVPRRRMWVKAKTDASGGVTLEYAGLARGEDPRLDEAVEALASAHRARLTGVATPGEFNGTKA
ncbi:MAG: cytochrome c biogenesis protein ResB [Microbacteriaceae bacterium]|nr:cytochrome c biogenesis protein ResB [Microbacteriaceae bacterium]MCL2795066.1 cytochrome c biogenesis protein ResB [Microbacteriaceae bacterium]